MAAEGSNGISSDINSAQPQGPFFIDTGGCGCALQEQLGKEAWRCQVNLTQSFYSGTDGVWFWATDQDNPVSLNDTENSDSNPPDTSTKYVIQDGQYDSNTKDTATDDPYDLTCSGENQTEASAKFYQDMAAVRSGQDLPCWQLGTIPLIIQDAASWNSTGCLPGFHCENNTATYLPTYCPPFPPAQMARLAGDTTPPMGPFEPVICGHGYYCPPPGKSQVRCPAGHFCPQGAYEPRKCSFAALCPPGTSINRSLLPFLSLVLLDIVLIFFAVAGKVLSGKRKKRRKGASAGKLLRRALTFSTSNLRKTYSSLHDEEIHLESRIVGVRRSPTGFLAAMDNEYAFGGDSDVAFDPKGGDPDIEQFVQSLSRCTLASNFGLTFEFENLMFRPSKSREPIVSRISGEIKAGTLWGVMGASGAGKSTFVNVLMGRQSCTEGVTKVNGSPGAISKYKKIIGYVPQDDVVLPELTVRENILHSARIRLPSNWKDDEINNHVDILLRCLHLWHVKDSLVGSTAAPIVSGGERKRVSIGLELAAAPMALFLDEPTSGLDATSASTCMILLKALSRLGITVVTIIHQPRHEIFEALDSLLLLGAGRTIYAGKEADVQNYFENSCGFSFPKKSHNPADVLMDIIAGQGSLYKKSGDTSVAHLIENWSNKEATLQARESTTPSTVDAAALRRTVILRGAPWYRQTYFCFCRALLQQYRRRSSFYYEIGVSALAGLLIGLAFITQSGQNFRGIFLHPYELLSSAVDSQSVPEMGLLVSLSIGLIASSPGVKIFGEEKLIYLREASSGHNRFAYYIGKVLSAIPRMVLANFHFTVLFILLSTPKILWGAAFVANLLYFYCIYGLASMVSMITRREDGPLIATMTSLVVGIISGVSPTLSTVMDWHMIWLWRASPGTWLCEAYFTENLVPYKYLYQIDLVAKNSGYNLNDFQFDLLMLFVLGTSYRVLAFLGMRVFNRKHDR